MHDVTPVQTRLRTPPCARGRGRCGRGPGPAGRRTGWWACARRGAAGCARRARGPHPRPRCASPPARCPARAHARSLPRAALPRRRAAGPGRPSRRHAVHANVAWGWQQERAARADLRRPGRAGPGLCCSRRTGAARRADPQGGAGARHGGVQGTQGRTTHTRAPGAGARRAEDVRGAARGRQARPPGQLQHAAEALARAQLGLRLLPARQLQLHVLPGARGRLAIKQRLSSVPAAPQLRSGTRPAGHAAPYALTIDQ